MVVLEVAQLQYRTEQFKISLNYEDNWRELLFLPRSSVYLAPLNCRYICSSKAVIFTDKNNNIFKKKTCKAQTVLKRACICILK